MQIGGCRRLFDQHLIMTGRFGRHAHGCPYFSELEPGLYHAGMDGQRLLAVGRGLFKAAGSHQGRGYIAVGVDIIGHYFQGLLVAGYGVGQTAQGRLHKAQAVEGGGIFRVRNQGLPIMGFRHFQVAGPHVDIGQVVVRLGVVGPNGQCLNKMVDGVLIVSCFGKGLAQMVVRFIVVFRDSQGVIQQGKGVFPHAHLAGA